MSDIEKPPLYCRRCSTPEEHWELVDDFRESLSGHNGDSHGARFLELQWREIRSLQEAVGMASHFPREKSGQPQALKELKTRLGITPQTPVEFFLQWMEEELYPPPEILESIATAFRVYFLNAGEISLEEAFFGSPQRGRGNYAQRRNLNTSSNEYRRFEMYRLMHSPEAPLEDSAAAFFDHIDRMNAEIDGSPPITMDRDVDSFLRGYRRYKKKLKAD